MELTNCNLSNGHAAQNHLWNRCKKNKTLNSFSSHDIYRNETMTPVFHQILPRAGAGGWGWFRMRPRRLLFAIFPNEFLHLQRKIKSWAGERKKNCSDSFKGQSEVVQSDFEQSEKAVTMKQTKQIWLQYKKFVSLSVSSSFVWGSCGLQPTGLSGHQAGYQTSRNVWKRPNFSIWTSTTSILF